MTEASPRAGSRPHMRLALVGQLVSLVLGFPAFAVTFMPTGDSITQGVGSTTGLGFRDLLFNSLNTVGVYDFVGAPDSGAPPYEGHFYGGQRIDAFRPGGNHDVAPSMDDEEPEIVAVHLGTNDLNSTPGPYGPWSNNHGITTTNTASGDLGALVKYLLDWRDGTNGTFLEQILLSRVVPILGRDADVAVFNREVVRMVLDFRNGAVTGSPEPVYLADHYLRFLSNPNVFSEWMDDALHPNDAGYDQMETVYFETTVEARDDQVAPAAPTDLAIGTVGGETALLIWTNTGDDGSVGNPSYSDCRYATGSINASNFRGQFHAGGYLLLGNGGELEAQRVDGLALSTGYNFAVKLMDDASQLSGMSNVASTTTLSDPDTWKDAFDRNMASPGPDWNADAEYVVNGELENTANAGTVDFMAIFTGVENPVTCQFDWGSTASQTGIDNAGFAVRLDNSDPATTDGYIVYRNVEPGQPLVLKEIIDGSVASPTLDAATPMLSAPQAGDEFRVTLTSDANGHHFAVFINGALDGVLTDPQQRHGNSTYYCGLITEGNLENNIDNWQVETVTSNLPPMAFNLSAPPNGATIPNLNPILDWQTATDPNGDPVTYTLFYSLDPGFRPDVTTTVPGLTESFFGVGTPLAGNQVYYWEVRAEDPFGGFTYSTETRSFQTGDYQQVLDNFERGALGPDWVADPTYFIANGELDCTGTEFHDIAVYERIPNPVSVEWKWSETSEQSEIGFAGCLIGMDDASTNADGYFVFRNTMFQQRWSVWEVENGELTGSLNIDQSGRNPIPAPGDVMRVVFVRTAGDNHFECYINGLFDARMTDPQQVQGNAATTYAGLLIGENTDNNIEEFVVAAEGVNLPPSAFNLLEPIHGSVLTTMIPQLSWQPVSDPNPGDVILYSVIYGLDPMFAGADTLPATGAAELDFTTKLVPEQPYYWKVKAEDSGGASVFSSDSLSFSLAQIQSVFDPFSGDSLSLDWSGDLAVMQVEGEELANTSPSSSFDMAVFGSRSNPDAVEFTWSPSADDQGISRGGLALRLDAATGSPSGYFALIDPQGNSSRLEEIQNGAAGTLIATGIGQIPAPGPGDNFKVILTSDTAGHHFYYYINDVFHSLLTDPTRRQGNSSQLFAGVALRGLQDNNVDNFMMQSFSFGPPAVPVGPPGAPLVVIFHPSAPNPFNPSRGSESATIAFELSAQATVHLTVYDLAGRAVRQLMSQSMGPGRFSISWDGRNEEGVAVGSGAYFAKLVTESWSGTRKLMLIK